MSQTPENTHWKEFGALIRQLRRSAELTQKQLAEKAEIHEVQLARIEKGESGTRRDTVLAIAKGLNVEPALLLASAGFALVEKTPLEPGRYAIDGGQAYLDVRRIGRKKPQNLPELLEALDALGIEIDWATVKGNFENYTEDDFEELKDQIAANAGIKIKRVINR